jgi:3-carboxy-cis,cis-muconate cycloisomerase
MVAGLEVDTTGMAKSLDITRGLLLTECLAAELTPWPGFDEAQRMAEQASRRATLSGVCLQGALSQGLVGAEVLSRPPPDLCELADWLGSSGVFAERALERDHKACDNG